MKRIIITLCICTAWVASTYAQYPYTLKKCLEEGLANNYSIRITRNEEQISHNNATLANAGYLPVSYTHLDVYKRQACHRAYHHHITFRTDRLQYIGSPRISFGR